MVMNKKKLFIPVEPPSLQIFSLLASLFVVHILKYFDVNVFLRYLILQYHYLRSLEVDLDDGGHQITGLQLGLFDVL